MSILDGRFTVLRLAGDEEITGDFALVPDVCGLPLVAFVDETAGVVVPWHAVQAAAVSADEPELENLAPPVTGRHKISIDGEVDAWSASCGCGEWAEQGPDKPALLDLAERHLEAQRRR